MERNRVCWENWPCLEERCLIIMTNEDFLLSLQVQFCIMGNLLRILLSPDPPSRAADIFVDFESKNFVIFCTSMCMCVNLFFIIHMGVSNTITE